MSKFLQVLEKAKKEGVLGAPTWSWQTTQTADGGHTPAGQEVVPPLRTAPTPGVDEKHLKGVDAHLVTFLTPHAFEAESYRMLGNVVERMHQEASLRVVGISSPSPRDGKTVTALNLVGALTKTLQARVLLVEADLRHPSVAGYLGLRRTGAKGLVDAIQEPALSLQEVIQLYPPFDLAVLPAGRALASPDEVLKSPRMAELLEEARRHYDYIVVDMPPLAPFADCQLIEKWIDGFLVVVAAYQTPRKLVQEALNTLEPDKVVGLVFNKDKRQAQRYYSDYYSHAAHE